MATNSQNYTYTVNDMLSLRFVTYIDNANLDYEENRTISLSTNIT